MGKPLWIWLSFWAIVGLLMIIDLKGFNGRHKALTMKNSLWQSAFYIMMGISFSGWIWYYMGHQSAFEYLTGYLVEKSLSLDNIFVFALIFNYFKVPLGYQHRVLFLGILGVLVFRAIMIALGAVLITQFEWVMYLFAAFLIFTGMKIIFLKEKNEDFENNLVLIFLRRHLRVTKDFHGDRLFVKLQSAIGKRQLWATPLFMVLVLIELSDVMFAVDSIPAIFTITRDPYIVYTSNIFAILGLRALYYALADILDRFHYLKYSLAVVLVFIGLKVFLVDWFHVTFLTTGLSLLITVVFIGLGVLVSVRKK